MEVTDRIEKIKIDKSGKLLDALKQMDDVNKKLLLVFDSKKFIGLVSIGDIQRAIIKGTSLDTHVFNILRSKINVGYESESREDIIERMRALRAECMPVVNKSGELVDILLWEEVFPSYEKRIRGNLNLPVVIMAGGEGTRLRPITNVLPKALIPINEKTILEEIMDRFVQYGCNEFFISVNYKAEMIRYYLSTLKGNTYDIKIIQEDKALGTAGSLYLVKDKISGPFFVSNCDILVDQDLNEVAEYHKENRNELTVVAALNHYKVPYGTVETSKDGLLKEIQEKPDVMHLINTGLYIVEPSVLNEITDGSFIHITTLITQLRKKNRRIGVYPISEKSWIDIGDWQKYLRNVDQH